MRHTVANRIAKPFVVEKRRNPEIEKLLDMYFDSKTKQAILNSVIRINSSGLNQEEKDNVINRSLAIIVIYCTDVMHTKTGRVLPTS